MTGTVVITGANGSLALGFVECFLESYPQHTLVATVRNPSPEKDPNTAKLIQLISKYPTAKVNIETLDLGELASVRSFAEKLAGQVSSMELPRISAVVCNASTWSLEAGQKFTADGYEASFQVCHLSHYLLVLKLLGSMEATSGRIVMLGSVTHDPEKPNPLTSLRPNIAENIEDLISPDQDPPGLVHDRGFQRYATAKLANAIFVQDINKRLQGNSRLSDLTATAMDPGGLPGSRAQTEHKRSVRYVLATASFFMPVLKHLTTTFRTTRDAGRDLVALSIDPEFHGKRGYYVGQKQDVATPVSTNEEVQKKLWDACWRWAGLSPEETVLHDSAPSS